MRNWLLVGVAVLCLSGPAGLATAQSMEKPDYPLAVRVGALFPQKQALTRATRATWFNVGGDYTIGRTDQGNDWIAALDLATARHFNWWALQGIYMWRNSNHADNNGFSFGVGGAAYFIRPNGGRNSTQYGAPVVLEWALSPRIFLAGKYHYVFSRTSASAFTAQVGLRF